MVIDFRPCLMMILFACFSADLENTKFIFAAFNYFTKSITNDIYIPAEFSACQFSLKSGICSIYSSHIDPGELQQISLCGQFLMLYSQSLRSADLWPGQRGNAPYKAYASAAVAAECYG